MGDPYPTIPYTWKAAAKSLQRTFKILDADESGFIEETEALAAGRALLGNADQAKKYWEKMKDHMDQDKNGRIEEKEFVNVQIRFLMDQKDPVVKATDAFAQFDAAFQKLQEGFTSALVQQQGAAAEVQAERDAEKAARKAEVEAAKAAKAES